MSEADVLSAMNDIKTEVVNGNLSQEEIEAIVKQKLLDYGIELTEETYNKLIRYLSALTAVKYDSNIKEKLSGLSAKIKNGFDFSFTKEIKKERGLLSKIWTTICNFFRGLFGGEKEDVDYKVTTEDVDNIFDDVNTDVYEFDDSVAEEVNPVNADENSAVEDSSTVDVLENTIETSVITDEVVADTETDSSEIVENSISEQDSEMN